MEKLGSFVHSLLEALTGDILPPYLNETSPLPAVEIVYIRGCPHNHFLFKTGFWFISQASDLLELTMSTATPAIDREAHRSEALNRSALGEKRPLISKNKSLFINDGLYEILCRL